MSLRERTRAFVRALILLSLLLAPGLARADEPTITITAGDNKRSFTRGELLARADATTIEVARDITYRLAMSYRAVRVAALLAGMTLPPDSVIEAVGIPATFELCEEIVAPGGTIANIGVHGTKVALHLECLWDRNITITTRLVDTVSTPTLLKAVTSKKVDAGSLITHRFKLDRILDAYDTFGRAAETQALKVIISP